MPPAIEKHVDLDALLAAESVGVAASVSTAQACACAEREFGIRGAAEPLPGETDANFLITSPAGRFVLRIAHSASCVDALELQVKLLHHVADADGDLPVQRVRPATGGGRLGRGPDGRPAALFSYLEGVRLRDAVCTPGLSSELGRQLGRLSLVLRGFDDSALHRPMLWDLAQIGWLPALIDRLPEGARAKQVRTAAEGLARELTPLLPALRRQVIHNDYSPDNVLVTAHHDRVAGILDFGDACYSTAVNDVAVAATYHLSDGPDLLGPAIRLIAAFHATSPLSSEEISVLPLLMRARLLFRLAVPEWRTANHPENRTYLLRNFERASEQFGRLLSVPATEIEQRIRCEATDDSE